MVSASSEANPKRNARTPSSLQPSTFSGFQAFPANIGVKKPIKEDGKAIVRDHFNHNGSIDSFEKS